MRFTLSIILFSVSMLFIADAQAQQRKTWKKSRYQSIKISKEKKKRICPVTTVSDYPYQSIGFKLGDPFALSYKLHASQNWGFVINMGRSATGLYEAFHKSFFYELSNFDTLSDGNSINYFEHQAKRDAIINIKVNYSRPFATMPALKLYLSAGTSFRWVDLDFAYIYESKNIGELQRFQYNQSTIGALLGGGLEYSHPFLPVSSFLEIDIYQDLSAWQNYSRLTGGVGLRYSF